MAGNTQLTQELAKKPSSGQNKQGISRGSLQNHVLAGVSAESPQGYLIPMNSPPIRGSSTNQKERKDSTVAPMQSEESHISLPTGPVGSEATNGFFYMKKD